jgi:hypothetical protein
MTCFQFIFQLTVVIAYDEVAIVFQPFRKDDAYLEEHVGIASLNLSLQYCKS